MKHTFLPPSSLFYVSLIASSYPSLSFRFEILENLKLTKEGISKVRAWAAPGLSAKATQRLGCFAATPAKNLSSSLNGSHFLPEEAEQPSSLPGRRGFSNIFGLPCMWSRSWDEHGLLGSITVPFSSAPEHCSSSWPDGGAGRDTESNSFLNFPFPEPVTAMTAPWYLASRLFIRLFVQVMDISCAAPCCSP